MAQAMMKAENPMPMVKANIASNSKYSIAWTMLRVYDLLAFVLLLGMRIYTYA